MSDSDTSQQQQPDYHSPVRIRFMRQAFAFLGSEWSDLGKANTMLNFVISAPLFRHPFDANYSKLLSDFKEYELRGIRQ